MFVKYSFITFHNKSELIIFRRDRLVFVSTAHKIINYNITTVFRFSFQDGHISTVCPAEDEPVWALNIKKAVLSTFQNRMERFDIHHTVAEVGFSVQIHFCHERA